MGPVSPGQKHFEFFGTVVFVPGGGDGVLKM